MSSYTEYITKRAQGRDTTKYRAGRGAQRQVRGRRLHRLQQVHRGYDGPIKTITKTTTVSIHGGRTGGPLRVHAEHAGHATTQGHFNAVRDTHTLPPEARDARLRRLLGDEQYLAPQFAIDSEGLWSMTALHIGESICTRLLNCTWVDAGWTVVDAFAGVGGNTIAFSRNFARVIAVEADTGRRAMLDSNLRLFGCDNVETYTGYYQRLQPYVTALTDAATTIIYFDPPWGIEYRRQGAGSIMVSGGDGGDSSNDGGNGSADGGTSTGGNDTSTTTIEELIVRAAGVATYCAVKLPVHYNMEHFKATTTACSTIVSTREYTAPYASLLVYLRYNRT